MVAVHGPTVDMAIGKDASPPEMMQMMENEMAKLWKVPMRRDNSWA